MIKVGVTGSNGFIGWHLCRNLELINSKFELIEFNEFTQINPNPFKIKNFK